MADFPVRVLSSMATREVLIELAATCAGATGIAMQTEAAGGVTVAERVRSASDADIVVLSAKVIDQLLAEARLTGERVDLARSPIAVAIPPGAARPDISTESGVRDAVLAARRLGYSTGPSGVYLEGLFRRWGILDTIRPRIVIVPPGVPVGTLVARGECDLGFQQLSELISLRDIQLLGPLPAAIQSMTVFSAALSADCRDTAAARQVLAWLASPATLAVKQRFGLEAA